MKKIKLKCNVTQKTFPKLGENWKNNTKNNYNIHMEYNIKY